LFLIYGIYRWRFCACAGGQRTAGDNKVLAD
jgi:hypothetical protein